MEIKCPQCGAGSTIDYNENYFKCAFCGTSLVLDLSNVSKHFITLPKIKVDQNYITSHLKTTLAKNEIKSIFTISKYTIIYYPFWCHIKNDGMQILLPAASSQLFDVKSLHIKAGEFIIFDPSKFSDETVIDADIHLESSLGQLENMYGDSKEGIKESWLIHYPFAKIEYTYNENHYDILLDMITEEFYHNVLPPTIAASITRRFVFISFVLLILFTLIGMAVDSFGGRLFVLALVSVPAYLFLKHYIMKNED